MPDGNEVYREAARKLYGGLGLRIPTHGFVQRMVDGGAYVEAVVWVSDEAVAHLAANKEAKQ